MKMEGKTVLQSLFDSFNLSIKKVIGGKKIFFSSYSSKFNNGFKYIFTTQNCLLFQNKFYFRNNKLVFQFYFYY